LVTHENQSQISKQDKYPNWFNSLAIIIYSEIILAKVKFAKEIQSDMPPFSVVTKKN